MTFSIFLILVTFAYAIQATIFIFALRRNPDSTLVHQPPFVSVIIAARNEEAHLAKCLESVFDQTMPPEAYEVVVVNDNSSDSTLSIAQQFVPAHSHLVIVNAIETGTLKGKSNALAQGIDVACGEIVLITDADCTVPHTWVEYTARRYSPEVGLIGGVTLQSPATLFGAIQSLDWAYILGLASATAALGNPLGSIGNNLSFRKEAYESVGGYRNLPFSVTEDYTLVQAILRLKKWRYLYPIDPRLLVESQPCPDWKTLIRQKHRWGKGGLDMKFSGFLIMAIGFLMHVSPFIMLWWGGVVEAASAFMVKFVFDYFFLWNILGRLRRTSDLKHFSWFEIYFIAYTLLLPFLALFGGRVVWKERQF
ncbi:MAG: glycosyltransferase [Ignavibacteriales bacterium]|nr:glycosyltransferase [Ignavibacteriales bacterium]